MTEHGIDYMYIYIDTCRCTQVHHYIAYNIMWRPHEVSIYTSFDMNDTVMPSSYVHA